MKQISVHAEVDKPTKTAVQRLAKFNKVSESVIVRWALDHYLRAMGQPEQPKEGAAA